MRQKIANFIFSMFFVGSYQKRAFGETLGVLFGILPIGHTAWIVGLILSLIFRLNLLAVYVGSCVSLLYPLIHVAVYRLGMDRFFPRRMKPLFISYPEHCFCFYAIWFFISFIKMCISKSYPMMKKCLSFMTGEEDGCF